MILGNGTTVEVAIDRALQSYARLGELGEEIDDEWSYVKDLTEAWRERLAEVIRQRGDEALDPAADAAIHALIAEALRISDPHRAIDWLSTFPQVALLALGEDP